jgi:negative regulator of sigma E activity
LKGASGGGVFWNGNHIAINWQTVRLLEEDGEVLEQFSTVALNSDRVVANPLWENS